MPYLVQGAVFYGMAIPPASIFSRSFLTLCEVLTSIRTISNGRKMALVFQFTARLKEHHVLIPPTFK